MRHYLLYFLLISTIAQALVPVSNFEKEIREYKLVIFLSSSCPCSSSHRQHLAELQKDFPEIAFFGVATDLHHSDPEQVRLHYSSENYPFPIISDDKHELVEKFRALKTPQVLLLKKAGSNYEEVFSGGLSDHRHFAPEAKRYLQENLEAIRKQKPLPHRYAKSLGCFIRRM